MFTMTKISSMPEPCGEFRSIAGCKAYVAWNRAEGAVFHVYDARGTLVEVLGGSPPPPRPAAAAAGSLLAAAA